jgi:hypothetical protein
MQGCQHERTEFLYRRDGIDYVRCLDCDQVFEADDLDTVPVYEEDDESQAKRQPHHHHHQRRKMVRSYL